MLKSRSFAQEAADLENHLATLSRLAELLAGLARHAETDAARRRIASKLAAVERAADACRARRLALTAAMNRPPDP